MGISFDKVKKAKTPRNNIKILTKELSIKVFNFNQKLFYVAI
ncbi:hypothetical protein B481_0080 [Planococcus halocryophilus Or1]|nr:hypothetical protein B481_0080 [Planococcus halocryophilus Or1]